MPIYCWKCEAECGKEVEILRSFADSGDVPNKEDTQYPETECEHRWIKQMQVFRLTKSVNWGPGKGNWGRS